MFSMVNSLKPFRVKETAMKNLRFSSLQLKEKGSYGSLSRSKSRTATKEKESIGIAMSVFYQNHKFVNHDASGAKSSDLRRQTVRISMKSGNLFSGRFALILLF
jgi:hypothetical protein